MYWLRPRMALSLSYLWIHQTLTRERHQFVQDTICSVILYIVPVFFVYNKSNVIVKSKMTPPTILKMVLWTTVFKSNVLARSCWMVLQRWSTVNTAYHCIERQSVTCGCVTESVCYGSGGVTAIISGCRIGTLFWYSGGSVEKGDAQSRSLVWAVYLSQAGTEVRCVWSELDDKIKVWKSIKDELFVCGSVRIEHSSTGGLEMENLTRTAKEKLR